MEFIPFLNRALTPFHASAEIGKRLEGAGFVKLEEGESWNLSLGSSYYLVRGESLVAAFRLPRERPVSAILLASHTDSPCLKLKPQPELSSKEMGLLGTEIYGAPLLHTWLDRDLILAGRVVTERGSYLIADRTSPVIIPELALHLDRSPPEKGFFVHKQDHLKALFSLSFEKGALEKRLASLLASKEEILASDLFLIPKEEAARVGFDGEMIASHRLDNLTSVYASLEAIVGALPANDKIQLALFFDHEEIGSTSSTGANTPFTTELLERILGGCAPSASREELYRLKARSLCLSIDVAHAFHPNFADKYDPEHSPLLGKGVIVKFHASHKYATSALSAAPLFQLAKRAKVAVQKYVSRSDIPSGSTVGPLLAGASGIATVDLGIGSLAMHSAREVVSAHDLESLTQLLKESLR